MPVNFYEREIDKPLKNVPDVIAYFRVKTENVATRSSSHAEQYVFRRVIKDRFTFKTNMLGISSNTRACKYEPVT